MNEEADVIVVGGGIAGVTCCETLAFLAPHLKIILLTKSQLIKTVTNLTAITKTIEHFDVEEKDATILNEKYSNITIIFDTLTEIHSKRKYIRTQCNRQIQYKWSVCLCTGGEAKLITTTTNNHQQSNYILGIRDTDSVERLQERVQRARNVLIIGNGGIATELVYELKNIHIVWAVKDHFISSTFLDPGAAQFFQFKMNAHESDPKTSSMVVKRIRYTEMECDSGSGSRGGGAALGPDWHTKFDISGRSNCTKNIQIEYNSEVESIRHNDGDGDDDDGWPLEVVLTNGTHVQCDLIISATGVLPCATQIQTDLVLELAADGGIVVNDQMETSIPGVYAAGDVCSAGWEWAKHWFQMRLWSQARQQGSYVAKSMCSQITTSTTTSTKDNNKILQDFCFELFSHSTRLFGYKVILLGLFNGQKLDKKRVSSSSSVATAAAAASSSSDSGGGGGGYECLIRYTPQIEYIKLIIEDGRIQGAILIGDTDLEETIENLILNQLDVTPYGDDLLNPDIDIEDYFD